MSTVQLVDPREPWYCPACQRPLHPAARLHHWYCPCCAVETRTRARAFFRAGRQPCSAFVRRTHVVATLRDLDAARETCTQFHRLREATCQ